MRGGSARPSPPQPLKLEQCSGEGAKTGAAAAAAAAGGGGAAGMQDSTLSSPIQVDRLAIFADMVTSPAGLARLASMGGRGALGSGAHQHKRPRLNLDVHGLVSPRCLYEALQIREASSVCTRLEKLELHVSTLHCTPDAGYFSRRYRIIGLEQIFTGSGS